MTDGSGATTWTYDPLGRPATETQSRSARTLAFTYDAYSQRIQLDITATGATPWRTGYGYDNAGRLRTVLDARLPSGQPYVYTYATNASLIAQITTPTGMKTTKTHDAQGRLRSVGNQFNSSSTMDIPLNFALSKKWFLSHLSV